MIRSVGGWVWTPRISAVSQLDGEARDGEVKGAQAAVKHASPVTRVTIEACARRAMLVRVGACHDAEFARKQLRRKVRSYASDALTFELNWGEADVREYTDRTRSKRTGKKDFVAGVG
jgi:hypothetical protein